MARYSLVLIDGQHEIPLGEEDEFPAARDLARAAAVTHNLPLRCPKERRVQIRADSRVVFALPPNPPTCWTTLHF
jgi:hypothetical protein